MMTRLGAHGTPAWAIAILFWRKVDQVESRGIPGIARSAGAGRSGIGGP
jgi:hypothetical protein